MEKEVYIPIEGMTCAACANRIEKGLTRLDGVDKANVNFATERAKIRYDSEKITQRHLKKKFNT
ncbi:lead, cadmium, zinc and mercury transporting ATPase [Bacillus sp. JCM 19047]|nr:lead, cadmium, zinc and mercury transporting ATPase [Bacillus sp. JCM 19047]